MLRRPRHHWRTKPGQALAARRFMLGDESKTRDQKRMQQGADPSTGNQVNMIEVPDTGNFHNFNTNTLEHVKVPEVALERRKRSDVEREQEMIRKYGPEGPGERLKKTMAQEQRDALEKQQDIDGLPWEVRWKRTLIPTHEEIIADIRDRFELFEVDPIERERSWYLHWRDRMYNAQRDRLVWPQGYTDYLDHYDENGVRRTLPSDQRWSDTSYKHLADTNYRDRLWMIEAEEKKMLDKLTDDERPLLAEGAQMQDEHAQIFMGIQYGVIDIDPDQAAQAIAGTADPLEVAKAKYKVNEYAAEQALTMGRDAKEFDPITGMPKSEREPFATGITVEQAATIEMAAAAMDEKMQQEAETAMMSSNTGPTAYARAQLKESEKAKTGDRPAIRSMAETKVQQLRQSNLELEALKQEQAELAAKGKAEAIADGAAKDPAAAPAGVAPSNVDRAQAALHKAGMDAMATADGSAPQAAKKSPLSELEAQALAADDLKTAAKESAEAMKSKIDAATAADATPAKPAKRIVKEPLPAKSGFIPIKKRPEGKDPSISGTEVAYEVKDDVLAQEPDWYRKQAIEVGPMIDSYGMTADPLEAKPGRPEYTHVRPNHDPKDSVAQDEAKMGENAFDEVKLFKAKNAPEITQGIYDGLPTYRDAVEEQEREALKGPEDDKRTKSEKLRDERRAKAKKTRQQFDPDLSLPDLPWETNPLRDPNRGVSDVMEVSFDRKKVEKVFRVYREFMQQRLVELANMSSSGSDEKVEAFMRDAIEMVRAGHVGDHPEVDPLITDIMKLVFEGHLKQFLSDYYSFRGGRKADSESTKSEAEDLMKRATGKAKQLGQGFVDLLQELTAVELDSVKKNPVQKYCILCREKSHETIAKPFVRWIQEELTEFGKTEFTQVEHIENHRNAAMKTLNEAKYKSPRRVEGVKDGTRDYIVEAFYHWGRAALTYHTGRQYWNFYLEFADSRFRFRAQEFFEESWEVFIAYYKTSREVGVHIPVPYSEPLIEVAESEFLEGDNGAIAEASGDFERAEKAWMTGTTLRWYPQFDETDYLYFNERRGKYSNAFDISDRTLEVMQKKTHPSIHPFPERAKKFLEGAPLTQETAEHLWLRHMGDLFHEHADFCGRTGKRQTAREHFEHGSNFYRMALREAKDRLPRTWTAPILTRVKLLTRTVDVADPEEYCKDVEDTINKIYSLQGKGPLHWQDRLSGLHWRVALLLYAAGGYCKIMQKLVQQRAQVALNDDYLKETIRARADKGFMAFSPVELAADEVAEEIWRGNMLKWRDLEKEGTDEWHILNLLYFFFRVTPRTPEIVDKYWQQIYPTYDFLYMRTALGSRNSTRFLGDVVRRMCLISFAGTREQKQRMLDELHKIAEKLHFALPADELKRTVSALELHMKDSSKPPYVYQQMTLAKQVGGQASSMNPLLRDDRSAREYRMQTTQQQSLKGGDLPREETNLDSGTTKVSGPQTGREMLGGR